MLMARPTLTDVYHDIFIHDDATREEPRKLFQRFHSEIREGQRMLVRRKMAILVHDRMLDTTKREYLIEYDAVPTDQPWYQRTRHTIIGFHHRCRLNGDGVMAWSYVDDPTQHRLTVLACHCSLLSTT